jgi:hypothetical protein
METMSRGLNEEYERIRSRTTEDPGTAGDEGEENWAALLREWLPKEYKFVTKGRILGVDGTASPQVDVLVLSPNYPPFLVNKKHYLAAGVVAAFECKLTLKAQHIQDAIGNAAKFSSIFPWRYGTPYRELNSGFIYGLLAHSHSWKAENSDPIGNLVGNLGNYRTTLDHPREMIDLVCVADLCTLTLLKKWVPHQNGTNQPSAILSGYFQHSPQYFRSMFQKAGVPFGGRDAPYISVFLTSMLTRLGWENPSLRDLADYFYEAGAGGDTNFSGFSHADILRFWPKNVLSDSTFAKLMDDQVPHTTNAWDEWTGIL